MITAEQNTDSRFTIYKNDHGQCCPTCGKQLVTLEDYIGGGSHYWSLRCDDCNREFTYNTYSFSLEPWTVPPMKLTLAKMVEQEHDRAC